MTKCYFRHEKIFVTKKGFFETKIFIVTNFVSKGLMCDEMKFSSLKGNFLVMKNFRHSAMTQRSLFVMKSSVTKSKDFWWRNYVVTITDRSVRNKHVALTSDPSVYPTDRSFNVTVWKMRSVSQSVGVIVNWLNRRSIVTVYQLITNAMNGSVPWVGHVLQPTDRSRHSDDRSVSLTVTFLDRRSIFEVAIDRWFIEWQNYTC